MPASVVKSKKDEEYWASCKQSVHKAHPDIDIESKRFYKIVMGCFISRKKASTVEGAIKTKRKK